MFLCLPNIFHLLDDHLERVGQGGSHHAGNAERGVLAQSFHDGLRFRFHEVHIFHAVGVHVDEAGADQKPAGIDLPPGVQTLPLLKAPGAFSPL